MDKYNNRGAILVSRKWLGNNLARHPGAFVVYFHILGWANHANGRLSVGQVALGERDFGDQLGMSVTTIRKWVRWLRDNGWVALKPVRWGKERGTIVTVLRYVESQSFTTYKLPSEDQKMILTPGSEDLTEDQKMILTFPSEDQKMILNPPESGSENDPSYTPISIRISEERGSENDPHSPQGEKGVGLSADDVRKQRNAITKSFMDGEVTRADWEREIQRLDELAGQKSLIVDRRGKKKKPAGKGDLHDPYPT